MKDDIHVLPMFYLRMTIYTVLIIKLDFGVWFPLQVFRAAIEMCWVSLSVVLLQGVSERGLVENIELNAKQ